MPTRRPNGDGSVRPRATKTRGIVWDVQLSLKDAQTQLVHRVTKRGFPSQKAAMDWKAKKTRESNLKLYTKPKALTVPALVRLYIDARKGSFAPSTLKSYERAWRLHIKPALDIRAESLTLPKLEEFAAGGPGPKARSVAVTLTKAAVAWGCEPDRALVPFNLVGGRRMSLPTKQRSVKVIPVPVMARIIENAGHEQNRLAWLLGAHLGPRRGEIIGLNWGDWDFAASTVSITAIGTPESDGRDRVERTKGKQTRPLPVPRELASDFLKLKLSRGAEDSDPVFVVSKGRRKGQRWAFATIQYNWEADLKRAGVVGYHLHDLRHTFATRALEAGLPVTMVSALLGHASPSTTLKHYGHVIDAAKVAAVDAVRDALGIIPDPTASKSAAEASVTPLHPRKLAGQS